MDTVLREVTGMLAKATGQNDVSWVGETTRLEDDLWLESIELAALGELMHRRYGDRVDLPAYLAGQDLDGLIALTVGDLVRLVREGS